MKLKVITPHTYTRAQYPITDALVFFQPDTGQDSLHLHVPNHVSMRIVLARTRSRVPQPSTQAGRLIPQVDAAPRHGSELQLFSLHWTPEPRKSAVSNPVHDDDSIEDLWIHPASRRCETMERRKLRYRYLSSIPIPPPTRADCSVLQSMSVSRNASSHQLMVAASHEHEM